MNQPELFEYCHYVFGTRERKPVFGCHELEDDLHNFIVDIATEKGFDIDIFAIMPAHVHLLIRRRLSDSQGYIMKSIKGISSRRIFQSEPSLKFDMGANRLWSRGYYVEAIPPERLEAIRQYIRDQKKTLFGTEDK